MRPNIVKVGPPVVAIKLLSKPSSDDMVTVSNSAQAKSFPLPVRRLSIMNCCPRIPPFRHRHRLRQQLLTLSSIVQTFLVHFNFAIDGHNLVGKCSPGWRIRTCTSRTKKTPAVFCTGSSVSLHHMRKAHKSNAC